jgi:EmrB/QacA subfamily drug resistance transporter
MNALDSTIVNVALPAIQRDLHFTQADLTWVVDAYLISIGSFLLMAGRLGDLIGRKRVFLSGVILFTAASAACAIAPDQSLLVAARFVQGIGAALSSSVIVAIIVTEFPEPLERARAMGIYVFVAVGGGSIGLLVGGTLTQSIDWRWIFLINVPIGIAAFVLGAILVVENEGIGLGHGVDVVGSVLVTAAAMAAIYAIVGAGESGWTSLRTICSGGLAIALLAAFVRLQSRLRNPIMPLRIVRLRSLMASSAVRALVVPGMFGSFFLGALYLEHVLGYGPTRTGFAFLPQTLAVGGLSAGLTARLVQRFGARRTLFFGLSVMCAGLLLLSRAQADTPYFPNLFLAFALLGIGGGTSFMPLLSIAMTEVPQRDAGLASGITSVSMQLSAAVGVAVLGAVATQRTGTLLSSGESLRAALIGGYDLGLAVAAGCVAAGLVAAFLVLPSGEARHG